MNFEINSEGGWIIPSGTVLSEAVNVPSYSQIGNVCVFANDCTFGRNCKFGNDCKFGANCRFDRENKFGNHTKLGVSCTVAELTTFGNFCSFGAGCTLGYNSQVGISAKFMPDCKIGPNSAIDRLAVFGFGCGFGLNVSIGAYSHFKQDCHFSELCEIGASAELPDKFFLRGTEVSRMFSLANVDGSGRNVIIARTIDNKLVISAGCFFGTVDKFCEKAEGEGKLVYSAVVRAAAEAFLRRLRDENNTT